MFHLTIFSQKHEAIIYMRDSSKLKGLARITFDDIIKYRKDKNSRKQKFNYKTVDRIIINVNDIKTEYQYKILAGEKPQLFEVNKRGALSLYSITNFSTNNSGGMSLSSSSTIYYVGKENSSIIEVITPMGIIGFKNFKKHASRYFKKDCPKLANKIKNKEFKRVNIYEIVDFYNEKCQIK